VVDFKEMQVEKEFRDEWDNFKMWDLRMNNPEPTYRAYSMANHPAEGNIVMLNIRIATPPWDRTRGTFARVNPGICSSFIFSRKPGDKVMIIWAFRERFISSHEMKWFINWEVLGGIMAPCFFIVFHLLIPSRKNSNIFRVIEALASVKKKIKKTKEDDIDENEFRAIAAIFYFI
jgi:Na+-transporting NADH:ubiquinone oxidoreductase subunit F